MDHLGELRVGSLTVTPRERRACFRESELSLTAREFEILVALARHPGWVFTPDQLAEADNVLDCASPSAVNVHIAHLRAKLAAVGAVDLIVTVRGAGWRIRRPRDSNAAEPPHGTRFVGRERELAALTRTLLPGEGSFALVVGEPGIGKTALLERALASAAPRFEVVRAVCDGNGSGDYWLWRQLLFELERRSGFPMAEQRDGQLLARLLGSCDDTSQTVPSGADRTLAYDTVRRYLTDVISVRSRPMVLFVDDLHWADDPSLRLLDYLLKRLAALPVTMLAASRESSAGARPALRAVFEFAALRRPSVLVRLTGLSTKEILELVRAASVDDPDAVARQLADDTGGNPLFIGESLRATEASGGRADRKIGTSLTTLAQDEVASLPAGTQRLLAFAAVTAGDFDPQVVARTGCGAHECDFDAALDAGILVPAARGHLRFRHKLIRDALVRSMPKAEREAAHRGIAAAIEASDNDPAARVFLLAHHYAHAGADVRARAVGLLVAAARTSSARFAFEDAIGYLQKAIELLATAALDCERSRRVRSAILEGLGGAHAALNATQETISSYLQAIDARPPSDALALARLHIRLGHAYVQQRMRAETEEAHRSALEVLDRVSRRDAGWWRSWIDVRLEQAEAATLTNESLPFDLQSLREPVFEHGSPVQRCKYLLELASALAALERWRNVDAAVSAAKLALDEVEGAGSDYWRGYASGVLAGLMALQGDRAGAERLARRSLGLTRRCADSLGEAVALLHLAMNARLSRDVRMTEAYASDLWEITSERATLPELIASAQGHLAWVALARGDLDSARARATQAIETWRREPTCSQFVWVMAWPAVSCALASDDAIAAVEFAALMTRPDQAALAGDLDSRLAEVIARSRCAGDFEVLDALRLLEMEAREAGYA